MLKNLIVLLSVVFFTNSPIFAATEEAKDVNAVQQATDATKKPVEENVEEKK